MTIRLAQVASATDTYPLVHLVAESALWFVHASLSLHIVTASGLTPSELSTHRVRVLVPQTTEHTVTVPVEFSLHPAYILAPFAALGSFELKHAAATNIVTKTEILTEFILLPSKVDRPTTLQKPFPKLILM